MKRFILLLMLVTPVVSIATSIPPCSSYNHKAFDFWVGSWVVTSADGSAAGKNDIVKLHDGCVLQENWVSAKGGFTGTSYNFYNPETEQWQQLWLDNQGGNLQLSGSREGNKMSLRSGTSKDDSGKSVYQSITWTLNEDGSVRQLWEAVSEKSVSVVFDGLYQKP